MGLRAGELRELLTLESPTRSANGSGGSTISWSMVTRFWGKVERAGGEDQFKGGQEVPAGAYTVTTHPFAGVTTEMRVVRDGRALDVKAIDDTMRDRLVLTCAEVLA
jgi:SPP1 family predicted phage head-tail adaptor